MQGEGWGKDGREGERISESSLTVESIIACLVTILWLVVAKISCFSCLFCNFGLESYFPKLLPIFFTAPKYARQMIFQDGIIRNSFQMEYQGIGFVLLFPTLMLC